MLKLRTLMVSLCCVFTSIAHAHHGIANFDLNADIELTGVITNIKFLNPLGFYSPPLAA